MVDIERLKIEFEKYNIKIEKDESCYILSNLGYRLYFYGCKIIVKYSYYLDKDIVYITYLNPDDPCLVVKSILNLPEISEGVWEKYSRLKELVSFSKYSYYTEFFLQVTRVGIDASPKFEICAEMKVSKDTLMLITYDIDTDDIIFTDKFSYVYPKQYQVITYKFPLSDCDHDFTIDFIISGIVIPIIMAEKLFRNIGLRVNSISGVELDDLVLDGYKLKNISYTYLGVNLPLYKFYLQLEYINPELKTVKLSILSSVSDELPTIVSSDLLGRGRDIYYYIHGGIPSDIIGIFKFIEKYILADSVNDTLNRLTNLANDKSLLYGSILTKDIKTIVDFDYKSKSAVYKNIKSITYSRETYGYDIEFLLETIINTSTGEEYHNITSNTVDGVYNIPITYDLRSVYDSFILSRYGMSCNCLL